MPAGIPTMMEITMPRTPRWRETGKDCPIMSATLMPSFTREGPKSPLANMFHQ